MVDGVYCFTMNVAGRRHNDLLVPCIGGLREAVRWGGRGIYFVVLAAVSPAAAANH